MNSFISGLFFFKFTAFISWFWQKPFGCFKCLQIGTKKSVHYLKIMHTFNNRMTSQVCFKSYIFRLNTPLVYWLHGKNDLTLPPFDKVTFVHLYITGPFPDPPYNLTVRQNAEEQLNISWNAPRNSPIPVLYYVIQFRTVGQ